MTTVPRPTLDEIDRWLADEVRWLRQARKVRRRRDEMEAVARSRIDGLLDMRLAAGR